MSSNASEQRSEQRLTKEINDLKEKMRQIRTRQIQGGDTLQIHRTPTFEASAIGVAPGNGVNFVGSLTWDEPPPSGNILLAIFEFALYVDTVDGAGLITSQYAIQNVFTWNHFRDQYLPEVYQALGNGSYPIVDVINCKNVSASYHDLFLRGAWRYITVEGDVSGVSGAPEIPDGPGP